MITRQEYFQQRKDKKLEMSTIIDGVSLNKGCTASPQLIIKMLNSPFKATLVKAAIDELDRFFNIQILEDRRGREILVVK